MVESMEKIVNLCKTRGYIYPGSEIYGGLANTWDYGPLGVELKNNVKALWRKKFIQEQKDIVGLDAAILMNPETWVASGHVGGFSDPLIDCKECKTRHRADKLIEEWAHNAGKDMIADGMTDKEMIEFIQNNQITCPNCGKLNFTDIRKFNLNISRRNRRCKSRNLSKTRNRTRYFCRLQKCTSYDEKENAFWYCTNWKGFS